MQGNTATKPAPFHPSDVSPELGDAQFARLAQRIHAETGIVINQSKRNMLIARLANRLRHLGLADFDSYIRLLDSVDGEAERRALVSAITTNVTKFFREPHHFVDLAGLVPELAKRLKKGGRVRIWSAGCSTGEEAYSIAATLLDQAPEIATGDLRILATDIDPLVIETARVGIYDRRSIGDETPASVHRFFQPGPTPGKLCMAPQLRSLIRFEPLNLLHDWPFHGSFDVVFCRNVFIYFDAETRHGLWQRMAGRIVPGGWLFIGHSERMDQRLSPLFEATGITRYRRTAVIPDDGPDDMPVSTGATRNDTCLSDNR